MKCKNHVLIRLVFLIAFLSCNVASFGFTVMTCDEIKILDSIKYIYGLPTIYKIDIIEIPEDEDLYPYGDFICKKIILGYENEIIPCLIERIKDTTASIKLTLGGDDMPPYYTVSDVTIMLLPRVIREKLKIEMPVLELFIDEFYNELNGNCNGSSISKQQNLFIWTKSKEIGYKNRIRFYNRVKRWYEKEMNNWKFDTKRCKN